MNSVNNITVTPSSEVQARLFETANQTALKYAKDYSSSTWHSWNVINKAAGLDVGLLALGRAFWHTTGRFATSLGVSTRIVSDLQATIGSSIDRDIRQYANDVHLLTSARHARSESEYHAVVAICFDTYALVIDHALHPTAMYIPLGGEFTTATYTPITGQESMARFQYFRADSEYKLTMDNGSRTYEPLSFSEIDADATTTQLAIPAALELQPVKGRPHMLLPPRKLISMRSLLDEQPTLLAAERVDGKWLATTLRVQLDFAERMLSVQIPMADWAKKEQGKFCDFVIRLGEHRRVMRTPTSSTWLLQVVLEAHKSDSCCDEEREAVRFLAGLCGSGFGLPGRVTLDLVDSVYRAWAPYRAKRADSVIDGGGSDEGV
ncbi:hypothetical protein N0V95_007499 [Ascochyta clinopodiicola]|nr:hypothetical protein N0V95_007499 [Ascochyta clinopodiicola]